MTIITKSTHLHTIFGRRVSLKIFFDVIILINILVLDPRISYDGLKDEFSGDTADIALLDQLETAKLNLRSHFNAKYYTPPHTNMPHSVLSSTPSSSMLSVTSDSSSSVLHSHGSPQKNFMARFQRKRAPIDELSEFWSLSQEDFHCDPVQWWYGRRAQFPNLYRLARDLFSIPGMYFKSKFSLSEFIDFIC